MLISRKNKLRQGFTLVELLIVAVVLSIFAAMVVPQLTGTADFAKEAALRSELKSMRKAIDLYYHHHGKYPANGNTDGSGAHGCAGSTTAAANTEQGFILQTQMYSNAAGRVCSDRSGGRFPYGPYLSGYGIPTNPVNGLNTIEIISGGNLIIVGDGAAAGGWKYNNEIGLIIPNDTNLDSNGLRYDRY